MEVDDRVHERNDVNSNKQKRKHLCPTCGSGFMKRCDLTRHERIHTGEKPYICDTCGSRFTQSSSLKIHLRKHTGEKPYKCLHCNESFSHSHRLKSHTLKFHINSPIKCNDCDCKRRCTVSDKYAVRPSYIPVRDKIIDDDHTAKRVPENLLKIDEKAIKCSQIKLIDERGFSKKNTTHTANGFVCNSEENYSNFSCKCYDIPSGVEVEMFMCHFEESKPLDESLMCDVCGLFFKDSSLLNNHLKIHRDDKPFKCSSCNLSFVDASNLKKHTIVHSSDKPFTCKVCRSSFSLAGNLKVHMRTHSGEKPFICELCGDRFKHSQALKAHAKVHTHNSYFNTCTVCGVSYSSFKFFRRHLQTHSKYGQNRGKSSVSISTHRPIFVIQEASVNQGLCVANRTSDCEVENKWSLKSQEVTVKTADKPLNQTDSEDASEVGLGHRVGEIRNRSKSPSTSPAISDEAFPTFQDHYLSETENAALVEVEGQNNIQDKMQSFTPNPAVINPVIEKNSSILAIQDLSSLKDSIPAGEEFYEISQTCDYYVSSSGRNGEMYPQSEISNTNQKKNMHEEESNKKNKVNIPFNKDALISFDVRNNKDIISLPPVFIGTTDSSTCGINPQIVIHASAPRQVNLNVDSSIDSAQFKGNLINSVQTISNLLSSVSNSGVQYQSSYSGEQPDQIKTSHNDVITSVTEINENVLSTNRQGHDGFSILPEQVETITDMHTRSSKVSLLPSSVSMLAIRESVPSTSNLMKKEISNLLHEYERSSKEINLDKIRIRSPEHNEKFRSFSSMLDLNLVQPNTNTNSNRDIYFGKLNLEEPNETGKTYVSPESELMTVSVENKVINETSRNLERVSCASQRFCNVRSRECTLDFFSHQHQFSVEVEEQNSILSENSEVNIFPPQPALAKNITSQSNNGFQVSGNESCNRSDAVAISLDDNLSQGNTKVITYASSKQDKSLYECSSSGKIDCQLAVKNKNMPAFTPSCISLEKRNEDNNISTANAETCEQRTEHNYIKGVTTSDYQKDQEIEQNGQIARQTRDQVVETSEETSEKELKCINCPLQLFDASVISVLCEDGCFGEMLERNSHYEEHKDINKTVADMPGIETTKAVSAALEQAENIRQEVNKEREQENDIDVKKVGEDFLTDTVQNENDILRIRMNKYEDRESVSSNDVVNVTVVALESGEKVKGFKMIPQESQSLIEQCQKKASVPNAENSEKTDKCANSSAIKNSCFSINRQGKKDNPHITQLSEKERHGMTTQESYVNALLYDKSFCTFNDDEFYAASRTEKVKEDAPQSKISTSTSTIQMLPVLKLNPVISFSEETNVLNEKSLKTSARSGKKRFTTKKIQNKRGLQKRTVVELNLNQDKHISKFARIMNLHEHFQKHENGFSTHNLVTAGFNDLYHHHCHDQVHTNGHSCICPICHLSFLFHKTLDNHVKMPIGLASSRSVKVLDGTAAESSSKYLFQQRMDVNSAQNALLYLCQVCGESLSSLSLLNHHMRSHKNKKSYTCKFCSAVFAKRSELAKHKRIHTCERPYKCDVCSRSFSQKTNLQIHMRTHTGERPFTCMVCKDRFAHSQALKLHLRFHAKDTQYICQNCGKGFVVRAALEKHVRSHTGEKPFVCHICDIKLSSQSSLSRHLKRHLGNDLLPFPCSLCSLRFAKSGHLRLHIKSHGKRK